MKMKKFLTGGRGFMKRCETWKPKMQKRQAKRRKKMQEKYKIEATFQSLL